MLWSDFVEAVRVDLPVDNERIGIATGNINFLDHQLIYGVIQIQQLIPFYQEGHETIYGANDLVLEGMASVGSLPIAEQCRPLDATYKTTGEQCVTHPFSPYSWGNRQDLVCGLPSLRARQFWMAIDPYGRQFTVFPRVTADHQVSLRWSGVKSTFADDDETPFDLGCAEAVGLFVKAKIARLVDHDMHEFQSYMTEWVRRRSLLYADALERSRLNLTAASQTAGPGCANLSSLCSGEVATENTVEFCAFGDSSNLDDQTSTLAVSRLVRELEPDFVMHLGDCNYPAGAPVTIQTNLLDAYGLYIPRNFFLAFGNHDIETDAGDALDALLTRQAALNEGKRYYSYIPSGGFCQLFVLDTNGDPVEQQAWLEAAVIGSSTWNIVVMHKSPYTSDVNHSPGDVDWQLPFKAMGINMVLSAHGHNYERLLVDGLTYIVCGLGGAPRRAFVGNPEAGSQFRYNEKSGTTYVTARLDRLQVTFYNTTGAVVDSLALEREQVFA